jgi:sulfur carrier protein
MNKRVLVNGQDKTINAVTIRELLVELGIGSDPRGVAVAIDGSVVPRSQWDTTDPQRGAAIDIVGAVQGG